MAEVKPEPVMEEKQETPANPKKRKTRHYKVAIDTVNLRSVQDVDKSGPSAAAAHVVRSQITGLKMQTPHNVWVRSRSKFHPYVVTRDYDNKKYRRFSITKGESMSVQKANEQKESLQIPTSLFE